MPTSRQLEIFIRTAELGSMRMAADSLNISQASVSKQLNALERHMGGDLFLRQRGRRAELSPLGRTVLADARQSLQSQDRMRSRRQALLAASPLRLHVRGFMASILKPNLDLLYARGLPRNIQIVLTDNVRDMVGMVDSSPRAVCLLGSPRPERWTNLHLRILATETCSLYGSVEMARQLNSGELKPADVDLFVFSRTLEEANWTDRLIELAQFASARRVFGPPFIEMVLDQIAEGLGVCPVMDWHAKPMVDAGKLAPVSEVRETVYLTLLGNPDIDADEFETLAQALTCLKSLPQLP